MKKPKIRAFFSIKQGPAERDPKKCGSCGGKKFERLVDFKDQWQCKKCGVVTVRADTSPRPRTDKGWPTAR